MVVCLRHRQVQHIRRLDVRHIFEYRDQLRQVVELGKAGLGTVARPLRGKLDSRDRFTVVGSPCVKMLEALLLQGVHLQIPLDGIQFHHTIGDGRTGGKHHAPPACDLVQIPALHKEVAGLLRFGLCDAADVPHFGIEKQIFIVMALVDEQPVNAQLLERDHIILAALVVQFVQLVLQALAGLFHPLDGKVLRLVRLRLADTQNDLVHLLFQNGPLPLDADGYLLELAVADDDRVVVAGGDVPAKTLAVLCFKILFRGHQHIGGRIELQELAGPLLRQVVWHHKEGLLAQAQPLGLHGRCHHLEGLTRTHHMGQQRIAAIENVGDGVHLMLPQSNLRIHAAEIDMAAIIFTGSVAVEQDVVRLADLLPPFRVFPDPFGKRLLQKLLLTLCNGGLLLVEYRHAPPVRIILVVKNANVFQVQAALDDLIGAGPQRAVGVERLDIALILALALDAPLAGDLGVMHLDIPPHTAGRVQRLKDELPDILRIQPCRTQPHGDLAGGQVYGLHLLQRFHVGQVLRLCFRFCPHLRQLPTHIAGQVLVGGQVFLTALFPVIRVQKNDALQIREQGILILAGELPHICHIHAGFLPDGQGQRFHRRVHPLGRPVAADGALSEQVCFPFQTALLVQYLQRTQQKIGAVLVKGNGVAAGVDQPVVMGKTVIEVVQLGLLLAYHALRIVLCLILQQRPHTIPQADHAADAALGGLGHFHRIHTAVLAVIELPLHQRIGEIADGGVCLDGLILALQLLLALIGGDLAVDILHGVGKQAVQRLIRKRRAGGLRAIRPRHHFHLTQHHIRMVEEIAVHGDTVIVRPQLHPHWLNVHHAVTLLQEQDV